MALNFITLVQQNDLSSALCRLTGFLGGLPLIYRPRHHLQEIDTLHGSPCRHRVPAAVCPSQPRFDGYAERRQIVRVLPSPQGRRPFGAWTFNAPHQHQLRGARGPLAPSAERCRARGRSVLDHVQEGVPPFQHEEMAIPKGTK